MDEIQAGSLVYIDTNVFVYFIETSPGFYPRVKALFERIAAVGASVVTNELTLAECVYFPSRENDHVLVALYQALFSGTGDVTMLPLNGALTQRAALAGGALGLKLMDAIHYVSALEAGCDVFVSGDGSFKAGPSMTVIKVAS
jgi:predicted nucleic acid-binding protein